MGLEITGKLFRVMPEESGTGKTGSAWRKQNFVIETADAYPKKICLELWGDKVRMLDGAQEGDTLKVSFDVESREWQDKWFTSAKAWRVEREGDSGGSSSDNNSSNGNTTTNNNTRNNAPIEKDPFPDDLSGGGDADLPF